MAFYKRFSIVVLILILLSPMFASTQEATQTRRASIAPSLVYLQPGEGQAFAITLMPGHDIAARVLSNVRWSVNDIPGGNKTVGTIDAQGLYHAPATLPSPREIHICAEAPEAMNRYLWATVILGDTPPEYASHTIWSEPIKTEDGGTEHLRTPHGIGVDKNGNIMITDQSRHTALRFAADGTFIEEIGKGETIYER